jgi:glycosyltransferase involved in cell wall biosynthesis
MASLTSLGSSYAASPLSSDATPAPAAGEREAVALLTGGIDKPYAFGLAMALASRGVSLDFIGSDEIDSPELHLIPSLRFLNLRGDQHQSVGLSIKIRRILTYYARLIRYAATAKPKLFHILWNNKFEVFDRTLLLLYYRLCGKTIVLTAHNVNAGKRDAKDSAINRLTLGIQYRLADHVFVHTDNMKSELVRDFGIADRAVSVIPLGMNNSAPHTDLTPEDARRRLGLDVADKVILFFGSIGPYKGLETLVAAFPTVAAVYPTARLIVVGKPKVGCDQYLQEIASTISRDSSGRRVMQRLEFIPDDETEIYFKAADVLVLPYIEVSQSGVLILGYSFGLPVVATAVGSLPEDIVEGQTGFLCKPDDPQDLGAAIVRYFQSDLYRDLPARRQEIEAYASRRYSWGVVADKTLEIYAEVTSGRPQRSSSLAASGSTARAVERADARNADIPRHS